MASLMFRANADNRYYAEANKPSGRGTWYVFYYDLRGKKVRLRVGSNKRVAEIAKGDIEARLVKQRPGLLDPEKELRRTTVSSFVERLPEFLETMNRAPKTVERYCGVFATFCAFLKSHAPHTRYLDQIEPAMVEQYKDHRRHAKVAPNGHPNAATRDGVSVRTLNNELTFLHSIFNLAKRRGFVRQNPLDTVERADGQKRKHYEPLSRDQVNRLIAAADDAFRPILLTFLLTGMRTGEVRNLEWRDLDFERDEIHIRAKEDWQPKDKESRTVPMHGKLKQILLKLQKSSDSPYVFGRGDDRCHNKLLRRLHATCRCADVPLITVHNLRDEFASHLVMQGVGIETVSKLLGHSDIQVTWQHYIHLAPQRLKAAVETLDWETAEHGDTETPKQPPAGRSQKTLGRTRRRPG